MTFGEAALFQEQMLAALEVELATARKFSAAERSTALAKGTRAEKRGKSFVYTFAELTGIAPEEGVQVTFTAAEKTTTGRYLGEFQDRFLFELDADIGETIAEASVTSDPLFLLERQLEILKSSSTTESDVALATVGIGTARPPGLLKVNEQCLKGLNDLQQTAVDTAASQATTYIWGPPGTGKTTVIGAIVAMLAGSGQRVLLVSNTNLAVDTALERCLDRMHSMGALNGGDALRIGASVKPELRQKYASLTDLETVVESETLPLQQEIAGLTRQLQVLQDQSADASNEAREYKKQQVLAEMPAANAGEIATLRKRISDLGYGLERRSEKIKSLNKELAEAEAKSTLGRMLSSTRKPTQIRRELDAVTITKQRDESLVVELSASVARLQQQDTANEVAAKKARAWLKANPNAKEAARTVKTLEPQIQALKKAIDSVSDQIAKKRDEVLNRAKVIACTAYRPLLDRDIPKMQFDAVIVDEASMVTLPLYFCNALLAKGRVIVAGDFRQLPPIVRTSGTSEREPGTDTSAMTDFKAILTANPFTKSGVIARSLTGRPTPELVALRDQYRMRSQIAELISENFYPEHTLRTMRVDEQVMTPWGDETFFIFDTSSLSPESTTVNGKSRRNVVHALVIRALVDQLVAEGWSALATAPKSFGIISPYAKQAALIEGLIQGADSGALSSGASTVHRFQGNERDLMVIDLTKVSTPQEPKLGSFLGATDPLAPENAMWNVAFSRARHHVVLIADLPTLQKNPSAVIARITERLIREGRVIDAQTVLSADTLSSLHHNADRTGAFSWFTDTSFYDAFKSDIRQAKSKVIIASPFATLEGLTRWQRDIENLKARSVQVICLTRPTREKDERSDPVQVQDLLNGIFDEVREVSQMHEKIAVIDDQIVWMGSLNILSHKYASEVMVRVSSAEFAQSISAEYVQVRKSNSRRNQRRGSQQQLKVGDPCDREGCGGTMKLIPAGVSSRTGKPYEAFLSCDHFRVNGCRNATSHQS